MVRETKYFPLSLESLRAVGGWAADCAERAVYEAQAGSDARPRAAIEGIRVFAGGGKRVARLRTLALSAHAAARDHRPPAARASPTRKSSSTRARSKRMRSLQRRRRK